MLDDQVKVGTETSGEKWLEVSILRKEHDEEENI
jgi:hypothetical protein